MTGKTLSVDDRIAVALLDHDMDLPDLARAVPAVSAQLLQAGLRMLAELNVVDVRRSSAPGERKILYYLQDPHGHLYAQAIKDGARPQQPPRPHSKPAAVAKPPSINPPPVKRTKRTAREEIAARNSLDPFRNRPASTASAVAQAVQDAEAAAPSKTMESIVENFAKRAAETSSAVLAEVTSGRAVMREYKDDGRTGVNDALVTESAGNATNIDAVHHRVAPAKFQPDTDTSPAQAVTRNNVIRTIMELGSVADDGTTVLQSFVPAQAKLVAYDLGGRLVIRADANGGIGNDRIELTQAAEAALLALLQARAAAT